MLEDFALKRLDGGLADDLVDELGREGRAEHCSEEEREGEEVDRL